MGSTRIKGTALSMRVDGVDYWADVTSCVMDGEIESVRVMMAPDIEGHTAWWFDVEAAQSTDPDSFWTFLFDHQGESVPFAYAPHGNATPTGAQPHFTGILTVPPPARLGGSAGPRVEQIFETRLHIAQGPYRVTTE